MAWTQTRNDIIARAYRICGSLAVNQNPSTVQYTNGANALQSIIEDLHNYGYNGNQMEWVTKTLTASSTVSGYKCIRSHTSASTNEPGVGADWESYWIVESTATGVWVTATAYTSIGEFLTDSDTMEIVIAYIRNGGGVADDESPLVFLSDTDFHSIPDKYSTGLPEYLYVESKENPRVYLYYQPDSTDYIVQYLRVKKSSSVDTSASVLDFEKRWWKAIVYQLAADLCDETLVDEYKTRRLEAKAKGLIKQAKKVDFYRNKGNNVCKGAYPN